MINISKYFDPIFPVAVIITLVAVFGFFIIWLESKKMGPFKVFRLSLITMTIACVTMLLLKPLKESITDDALVLLTPGFERKDVDSLLNATPNTKVISVPGAEHDKGEALKHVNRLSDIQHGGATMVIGGGLSRAGRDILKNQQYSFAGSSPPAGIQAIFLPDNIILNRANEIEGVFHNVGDSARIVLIGPGGREDSVIIRTRGRKSFTLRFTPKTAGKFLYQVLVDERIEYLPVEIKTPPRYKILFIHHFPTFETQYLKTLLSAHHETVLRYQLSKDVFRYEYINTAKQRINRITKETLDEFDLLIIDSDALATLSSGEKTAAEKAVESGLGMLILFNQPPDKLGIDIKSFIATRFRSFSSDTAHLVLNATPIVLPALPSAPQESEALIAHLKNKNRILSGYHHKGSGKVGFQLLQQSYRLYLEGDTMSYNSLWMDFIARISRGANNGTTISLDNKFPIYPDEPVSVSVTSTEDNPALFINQVAIPLQEDILFTNVWQGKIWFDHAGWHTLISSDSTRLNFYVSDVNSWESLRSVNQIAETILGSSEPRAPLKTFEKLEPVPPLIFVLGLMLCLSTLWLLPKL